MATLAEKVKKPREYHCGFCANHGEEVKKTNHVCKYSKCVCYLCDLTRTSQQVMKIQQSIWRALNAKMEKGMREDGMQYCDKCRNHGILWKKKYHKQDCEKENCVCNFCNLTEVRRNVMRLVQRVKRAKVTCKVVEKEEQPDANSSDPTIQPESDYEEVETYMSRCIRNCLVETKEAIKGIPSIKSDDSGTFTEEEENNVDDPEPNSDKRKLAESDLDTSSKKKCDGHTNDTGNSNMNNNALKDEEVAACIPKIESPSSSDVLFDQDKTLMTNATTSEHILHNDNPNYLPIQPDTMRNPNSQVSNFYHCQKESIGNSEYSSNMSNLSQQPTESFLARSSDCLHQNSNSTMAYSGVNIPMQVFKTENENVDQLDQGCSFYSKPSDDPNYGQTIRGGFSVGPHAIAFGHGRMNDSSSTQKNYAANLQIQQRTSVGMYSDMSGSNLKIETDCVQESRIYTRGQHGLSPNLDAPSLRSQQNVCVQSGGSSSNLNYNSTYEPFNTNFKSNPMNSSHSNIPNQHFKSGHLNHSNPVCTNNLDYNMEHQNSLYANNYNNMGTVDINSDTYANRAVASNSAIYSSAITSKSFQNFKGIDNSQPLNYKMYHLNNSEAHYDHQSSLPESSEHQLHYSSFNNRGVNNLYLIADSSQTPQRYSSQILPSGQSTSHFAAEQINSHTTDLPDTHGYQGVNRVNQSNKLEAVAGPSGLNVSSQPPKTGLKNPHLLNQNLSQVRGYPMLNLLKLSLKFNDGQ